MASKRIYQFYAELQEYEPAIWRRFQVTGMTTLAKLSYTLMCMFEMHGSHLFELVLLRGEEEPRRFGFQDRNAVFALDGEETEDLTAFRVKDLQPEDLLVLTYDFGDSWEVAVRQEAVEDDPVVMAKDLPRVLEGEGYGIIEDCGGVTGLEELAEAFQKKEGEAYEELSEWLGETDLDLTAFDPAQKNQEFKRALRFLKSVFED